MNNDCTLQPLTCVDYNLGVSSCHTRDYVISTCHGHAMLYMLVPWDFHKDLKIPELRFHKVVMRRIV